MVKTTKQAAEAYPAAETRTMRVRIEGLRQIDGDEFEMTGLNYVSIDWGMIQCALMRDDLPEMLANKLHDVIQEYSLLETLAARFKIIE